MGFVVTNQDMTNQQREIGTRIRERLLARIPELYKLRIGYRLPISDEIPLIETNDADLDAIITKDGERTMPFSK